MPNRTAKLTTRTIKTAAPEAKRYVINDTELPGFRLVVSPAGRKTFAYRYRVGGGRGGAIREPSIGTYGSLTADQAREIAQDWAARARAGEDPSQDRRSERKAPNVDHLLKRYLSEHADREKKASSALQDRRLIERVLLPSLGKKKVTEVTRADVSAMKARHAGTPYLANRALALLSKAMNLAEEWGLRKDGTNPCRHVKKFAEEKRRRFLSPAEMQRLGAVLREAEEEGRLIVGGRGVPVSVYAVAAIRLLILTGARKSKILGLRWEWIDHENGRVELPDSKTGEKFVRLPPAALAILEGLPRHADNPHVIVGAKPGASLVNVDDAWRAVRSAAELADFRIHDLRHSFASVGAAGGMSLPVIGALLGQSQPSTTARYAHLADDPLRAAAADIGSKIDAAMSGRSADVVKIRGEP